MTAAPAAALAFALFFALLLGLQPVQAQIKPEDAPVVEAREALRSGDRKALSALRERLVQANHPLALWADYWDLSSRLAQVTKDEVEAFYQRWPDSYVEDRLRNDWLLELGRRRDWPALLAELPRFRMKDDREVNCYAHVAELQAGRGQVTEAVAAWRAQRESDAGCQLLAEQLKQSGHIASADLWQRLRWLVSVGRQRAARQTAELIGPAVAQHIDPLWSKPARFLSRLPTTDRDTQAALAGLATTRLAATDPEAAAELLTSSAPWVQRLKPEAAAAVWGSVAFQATLKHLPEAAAWADKALSLHARSPAGSGLWDEALAWVARAHLRETGRRSEAWFQVQAAIDAMGAAEQQQPVWSYWKARALLARSRTGAGGSGGESVLLQAQAQLQRIASPLHFYGQLALEELGQRMPLPAPAAPLQAEEREQAAARPGLQRALRLIEAGLRSEGQREWNFTLIGLNDRQLLAAAKLACERGVWDRCMTASERTQQDIDLALRFPLAFYEDIHAAAQRAGLEASLVSGLIRQESRFVVQARSHVGASGLMQVMPSTARWVARRVGMDLKPDWREDRSTNLALGTTYLRLVLDDFGGSWPMALAAYNAGPGRPRRWRETAVLEPAVWTETIPIHETRDYVKKVLSNATVYAQRLDSASAVSLKQLLGAPIGPRQSDAPEPNKDLP